MAKQVYTISIFKTEDELVSALSQIKGLRKQVLDIFTPYPIHDVLEFMGKKSKMTYAAWIYGFATAIAVLGFLYWAAVISWPLDYGGKPFNSFPSFIIITLILVILSITILSLFTFSVRANIYPGKHPEIFDTRATDDKFIIVFDGPKTEELVQKLGSLGAEEIISKQ